LSRSISSGPGAGPSPRPLMASRRRGGAPGSQPVQSRRLQPLGDEERQLERLAGVEARVAMRVIAIGERMVVDRFRAARALGHVLAGHLEMDAAAVRALARQDLQKGANLGQNMVER